MIVGYGHTCTKVSKMTKGAVSVLKYVAAALASCRWSVSGSAPQNRSTKPATYDLKPNIEQGHGSHR
jgi:hypothetical protein